MFSEEQEQYDQAYENGATSAPPELGGLGHDEAVKSILEWFHDNFEDPAESTPWDEGEYIYIWGGPYGAREEINAAFSDRVAERTIEAAIEQVERRGCVWAPSYRRMRPER
jgi:hypothetical protein